MTKHISIICSQYDTDKPCRFDVCHIAQSGSNINPYVVQSHKRDAFTYATQQMGNYAQRISIMCCCWCTAAYSHNTLIYWRLATQIECGESAQCHRANVVDIYNSRKSVHTHPDVAGVCSLVSCNHYPARSGPNPPPP